MSARSAKLLLPLLPLAVLAILPFATDGGQAECCNVTGSLASTAVGPVNGDESFFSLPSGPANIMLLLDDSGSMNSLPACGDGGWTYGGNTSGACKSPTITAPADPSTSDTGTHTHYTVAGTCAPSAINSGLAWMEKVVPKTELADPGRTNTLVTDAPPWGDSCLATGVDKNKCLFDPEGYFFYGDWTPSATAAGTKSTRRASDRAADATTLPKGCIALNASGAALADRDGNKVDLGDACRTCMTDRGFYFYKVKYIGSGTTVTTYPSNNSDENLIFKGTFLNAYPPKFVAAKKVIKDVAFLDPAVPSKLDQVRLGLTRVDDGGTSPRKGVLVVPLGPDKSQSFPPTQAGFAQARQYILSVLNYDKAIYKDVGGNVICDGTTTAMNNAFFNPASGSTPLGTALLNVGQYFSSINRYDDTTFLGKKCSTSKTCQTPTFDESASGAVNAPWARANPNQCSICWGCQNNAVVILSDGSPNSEISLPTVITSYDNTGFSSTANCGATGGCGAAADSVVVRLADWLHYADLRANAAMSGRQALTVHTVGIDITKTTNLVAYNVLNSVANLSGGIFQSASNPTELANAVATAINKVLPKENSFSAASATSLQTVQTAAAQAFLTRFKPNQTPTWEGHVFETFLFDEFLNGCDSTQVVQKDVTCQGKTVSADFNGDGKCGGVFLIDSDCDEIAEDPVTGEFLKKGLAQPANVAWDAGKVLSTPTATGYKSADETASNARTIFTYINGVKEPFTAANAAKLLPYLNISAAWCTGFLTQLGITSATPTLTCAQQVIYFVRGWDTLNQDTDGCWGPGNSKNLATCKSGLKGEERDRANDGPVGCVPGTTCTASPIFWKLGDIFHSSPAILLVPSDEIRCDTGYDVQCVATLHSPSILPGQTPIEYYELSGTFKVDAYERYRRDKITRKRVVLVGANDGMLHAFDAGDPDTSKPPDITGSYPYTVGTGSELWAFVPPDLLPRLKDLTNAHQYMVDGSVMLRDVWVDGIGTEVSSKDRKKQRDEYRTMAIFGRRAGGTAYSALDVTDPLNPVLKWSFPKDCSEDARYMGESWSDFSPRPPPIFPVRIKNTVDTRGFEERWVVGINGGYDPMLNLGRAMFMLDVWTGATLWRYTDADFKADTGYGSGTSMFPVPAAMAPVDIGDPSSPVRDMDGFFDTATWGDLGGNLWVARFHEPGEIDTGTGRVKNWFVGRAFEQRRQTDDSQKASGRNEFFYMTANAFEATNRTLRTFVGSGNRERIMSQIASCGTNNLLACAQAGCTKVTSTTTNNYGACNGTTTFSATNGAYSYATSSTASCGTGVATCASGANFSSNLNVHWECPGAGTVLDATGSASCDASGLCTVNPMAQRNVTGTFTAPSHNRFYGVWSYGRDTKKMFKDKDTAKAFDANRFTDIPYSGSCTGPRGGTCTLVESTRAKVTYDTSNPMLLNTTCPTGVTKCAGTVEDAGWFYEYGQVCPLASCAVPPPWTDEKTGSGATVMLGCVLWGSFRPVGATTSTDPCAGNLGVPAAYRYTMQYISGTPNPVQCGGTPPKITPPDPGDPTGDPPVITDGFPPAGESAITAPPNSGIPQVTISGDGCSAGSGGGIGYGTLDLNSGQAASKTQVGTRTCAMESIYWLEVPREVHDCRHRPVGPGQLSTCD